MTELRVIKTCFSLILGLQITAVTGQIPPSFSYITVRAGDDVTLSCTYVIDGQHECYRTNWFFSGSRDAQLVRRGKIVEKDKSTSDRLSVPDNCSLVLKKVSAGDVGFFECQQLDPGVYHFTRVYLSVVTITAHDDGDEVTLTCSVSPDKRTKHTVKWLFEGRAVGEGKSGIVTFPSSDLSKTKNQESYQCQVNDDKGQRFTFTAPTSGEKPDVDATTTRTTIRTTNRETPGIDPTPYVAAVAGGLAALLIAAVVLFIWKRRKGRRTQTDQDAEKLQQPNPEEEVSYATVNYIKNKEAAGAQAPVRGDEGDNVTYSTVKVSSSSTHPSDINANVNKPRK